MEENMNIKVLADREDIVAIADAVRSKTGSSSELTLDQIVSGINSISGNGGSNYATPDWNINDENDPGYIKNRPFYDGGFGTVTILEHCEVTTVSTPDAIYAQLPTLTIPLEAGQIYIVTINGTRYECIARGYHSEILLGNGTLYGDGNASNNEPFCILYSSSYNLANLITAEVGAYTISIEQDSLTHFAGDIPISGYTSLSGALNFKITVGAEYTINFNGVRYVLLGRDDNPYGIPYIGNPAPFDGGEDNGIPFNIVEQGVWANVPDGTYPLTITTPIRVIHKIAEEFIPDSIPRAADLENTFELVFSWLDSLDTEVSNLKANTLVEAEGVSF